MPSYSYFYKFQSYTMITYKMTEHLTTFANVLDELFKGLSECGLMTSYTVQLQSNLVGLETLFRFRTVIQQLIEHLQSLLLRIPSVQSAEASTQTLEEVVVTCHPISITTLRNTHLLSTHKINNDRLPKDRKTIQQKEKASSDDSHNKNESEHYTSLPVPSIELCELKPLLIEANENFSQLISLQPSTGINIKKDKLENIVHIVVEAPSVDSETKTDIKIEEVKGAECDVLFKCREEQKLHVHTQSCDMCDKVFNCLLSLQEHCRKEHDGIGCFLCSTCNKRFMTKLSYNRHIDTHKGKKDAVCNLCGKAFSRSDYLQTHYQTHLGKRNFACSQCPRKFFRSIHLRAHEKIHSGIKDHICKVCNKGFVRRDKLKEHVLRHLNIKRFQCPICQRDYAEKRDLKVHLKSHSK